MRKRTGTLGVLGLLTLSACGDPASQSPPQAVSTPAQIAAAGTSATGGSTASGGSPASGGTSAAGAGGTAAPPMPTTTPTAVPTTPPTHGMVPNLTPAEFCGMIRVDEGGAIVIAGCEENIRVIHTLDREQVDGGAWHSTAYGFEAPCNEKGTYRATVSEVHYDTAGLVDSYLFVIRSQGGYEVGGSMALARQATQLSAASGSVQGNQCQFSVCAEEDCGVLDTTQLSTVSGNAGAGSPAQGGASVSTGGTGGTTSGGAGGRGGAGGGAGASTGGRSSFPGFPTP